MSKENRILRKFGVTDVVIEVIEGVPMFELYSVGKALGYVKSNIVKGKTYYQCRKDRVEKLLTNAEITPLVHDGLIFLSESQLYDFMLEAHTEKCKPFRKWVLEEVLPTIERTSAFIEEGHEEEVIDHYFPSFSDDVKLMMLKDLQKAVIEEQNRNAEIKDFYERVINSEGLIPINTVAKELEIGEHKLFKFLRDRKVFYYNKYKVNLPYERFRKEGKFKVKETPCPDGVIRPVTYATQEGKAYILKLLSKYNFYNVVAE